jgi:CheY-like chemotaxis protein
MPITVALAIGFDPWLFEAQRAAWRSAGYFVTATGSIEEAIRYFRCGDFDLVLLDNSIPRGTRDTLSSLLRTSGSLVPVYCAADSSGNIEEFRLAVTDGPHSLAGWIGRLAVTPSRKLPVSAAKETSTRKLDEWFYRLRA